MVAWPLTIGVAVTVGVAVAVEAGVLVGAGVAVAAGLCGVVGVGVRWSGAVCTSSRLASGVGEGGVQAEANSARSRSPCARGEGNLLFILHLISE
jgi:hypothetical protein